MREVRGIGLAPAVLVAATTAAVALACRPHPAPRPARPGPLEPGRRPGPRRACSRLRRRAGRSRQGRGAGARARTPFLDLRSLVVAGGEQGLLGLAFPPGYARVAPFYVNYSARGDGATDRPLPRRRRTRAARDRARAAPRRAAVREPQRRQPRLRAGRQALGRAGRRRLGRRSREPRAGQVDTCWGSSSGWTCGRPGPMPELVALGLRNPWRYAFDRATGDLWIGDVGQGEIEEIDRLPHGRRRARQLRLGRLRGSARYEDKAPGPGRLVGPIAEYSHGEGCSVTGGYVYRGTAVPALRGALRLRRLLQRDDLVDPREGRSAAGRADHRPAAGVVRGEPCRRALRGLPRGRGLPPRPLSRSARRRRLGDADAASASAFSEATGSESPATQRGRPRGRPRGCSPVVRGSSLGTAIGSSRARS